MDVGDVMPHSNSKQEQRAHANRYKYLLGELLVSANPKTFVQKPSKKITYQRRIMEGRYFVLLY